MYPNCVNKIPSLFFFLQEIVSLTEEYLDVLGTWAVWQKQTMQVGLISLRELENLSSMKEDKAIMILHKEAWSWATKWATFYGR